MKLQVSKNNEVSFAKSVMTLMSGAGIAQLIPLLISPILTRLYTPEEFGLYAIFMGLTTILAVIVTGRFEMASLVATSDVQALSLSVLASALSFALSAILFVIVIFWAEDIADFFKQPELEYLVLYLPFSVFAISINQILNNLSNSRKKYIVMAKAKIIQSITNSLSSVSLGGFISYGLVLGQLIGAVFSSLYMIRGDSDNSKKVLHYLSIARFLYYFKKNSIFPRVSLPHALLTKVSSELPVLMINYFFSSMAVGSYSLANKVLLTPLGIISTSLSQVYVQQLGKLKNSKNKINALKFHQKTVGRTLIISAPFFILIFCYLPYIFEIVFGADWKVAGYYSQLLLPMLYFRFVGSIVSTSVIVYKQQNKALILEIISVLGRLGSLLVGGWLGDIYLGLLLFSISSTLVTVYRLFWYNNFIKREVKSAI